MFELSRTRRSITVILGVCALGTSATAESTNDLPDPTRPAFFATEADPETVEESAPLELSAVFFASDRSVAIINGVRAQNGDTIGNARVVQIFGDRVRVEQNGKTIELRLIRTDIKEAREASP